MKAFAWLSVWALGSWGFGTVVSATPDFPQAPGTIQPERIIGENNLEPIENAAGTTLYDMARSVARVEMGGGYCTGFRVSEDLMMTNHHCLSSCSSMRFRFGYERNIARDQQVIFKCTKIESSNSTLDYALIRVTLESGNGADLIPPVTLDRRELQSGQLLFLAGHPAARMKEMDRSDNCKVHALPTSSNNNLTHTCDTEGGNSGSSVFDRETGHVIGLHWGYSDLNQANWMHRILQHVETGVPAVYEELTVVEQD